MEMGAFTHYHAFSLADEKCRKQNRMNFHYHPLRDLLFTVYR
jgi:hypothetical protein